MKKHILLLTVLFVGLFTITPGILTDTSNERGEEQFLQGAVLDEASEKFDVHAMGISKEQHIVSVHTFNADLTDEIETYFKKQLILHGMKDYEIEIYADEKDGVQNWRFM